MSYIFHSLLFKKQNSETNQPLHLKTTKLKLTSNLNRLSLHDSYFTDLKRTGKDIELAFDWAKLKNFIENDINEGIILGATKLSIKGIANEKFRGYYHKEKVWESINIPENIVNSWHSIAENHINEITKEIMINGMFTTEKEEFWIEWTFKYESYQVEWNNHITVNEWRDGKLPND